MEMLAILKRRGMLMVSVIFSTEKDDWYCWWSWVTHRSRTPGLEWWRTLHMALPAGEWVLLGSPSSFLRILLYTLISSDEMTECFWLKSEGEISKWTHHMRAEEDIQVGDRDPESKKRLMCRLGWLITRVQIYQYISPTSLHPLLKSNEQKTHIRLHRDRKTKMSTEAEKRKAFAAIPDPCTTC